MFWANYFSGKALVAFTRVITDYVFKALILDVMAAEKYRGHGLGRQLMDAVVNHPDLATVKHIELYCAPAMIPFYAKWGFRAIIQDEKFIFMRRTL